MKICEAKSTCLLIAGAPASLCTLRYTWTAASPSCLPPAALIVSVHGQRMDAAS